MHAFHVRPVSYALGAEVTGLNLKEPLDDATIAALRKLWLENVVLYFPNQDLSPAELMAFSGRFGELDDGRSFPHFQHPDYQPVSVIVNQPITIEEKAFSGGIADEWHTDGAFTLRPASASFLNAKVLPELGGNTAFANLYRAYETLSPAMRQLIEPLEAVHDTTMSAYFKSYGPEEAELVRRLNPPVVHPVVRRHPETGRPALYVGNRVRNFVGMTEEETRPLRDFLNEHATRYENTYRHGWRLHDLVMWDNRCALHRAIADYDRTQLREMIRCELLAPKSGRLFLGDQPG